MFFISHTEISTTPSKVNYFVGKFLLFEISKVAKIKSLFKFISIISLKKDLLTYCEHSMILFADFFSDSKIF